MSSILWYLWGSSAPTPQQIITDALNLIGTLISPVARYKIEQRMRAFDGQAQTEIVQFMLQADTLPYANNTQWRDAARAWIMVRLALAWTDNTGRWFPDSGQRALNMMRRLLQEVGALGELAVRNSLREELGGDSLLRAIHRARRIGRSSWSPACFTSPKEHKSSKFRYIIHAMGPPIIVGVPDEEGELRKYFVNRYGTFLEKIKDEWFLSVAQLYLEKPEFLLTELLSCSIIDQDHTTTYKDFCFGLILTVPEGNIVTASSTDMAAATVQNMGRGNLLIGHAPLANLLTVDTFLRGLRGAYEYDLPTPDQVLLGCSTTSHNEVLVLGSFESDRVLIGGIFIKVTSTGMILQSFIDLDVKGSLTKSIRLCSETLKIPIVPIVSKGTGSTLSFDEWLNGKSKTKSEEPKKPTISPQRDHDPYAPPMGLHLGREWTYRDEERTRTYDRVVIMQRAVTLLATNSAAQTHRIMHDQDGIPHQICERVLNNLGYFNYI